ncbi:DUF3168 domain-containing protein [Providencia alcalifaciens]|uniref:DUF3168 domain-containing protein n=1 Tax=Providencia alcalifaciens DSM 30120 TaxID=520999 RepID=B6XBS6_9GAMM|nr:DUF3168 domain-containing protein [Providencia alcalifaciens]ATG18034.1 DUF3168 domain-containing protein [Providencia alcalifaciens]EEB47078.1 hypothetical protein PROVALCAL_00787 [Providencia alcalifaciens DSM 30120]SQI33560.1 Protein of uncharacterised function (DUF3168) [Providencia alcalifaciens]
MTESDLFHLLSPVLPSQVFPYVAPQEEPAITPPWLIFSFYDIDEDVLSGQASTMTQIQIDVYAKTPDMARDIRAKALLAIQVLAPVNIVRKQDYEPDTSLYRATIECQVWQ